MQVLIDTERKALTPLDALCRSVLKVREDDGMFKTCDVCSKHVPDESLEFSLQARVIPAGPSKRPAHPRLVFAARTRHAFFTCSSCRPQGSADAAVSSSAAAAAAAAAAGAAGGPGGGTHGATCAAAGAAAAAAASPPAVAPADADINAGEEISPVHLQGVYRYDAGIMSKTFSLVCPDCGINCKLEAPCSDEVREGIRQHLASTSPTGNAADSACRTLRGAFLGGKYEGEGALVTFSALNAVEDGPSGAERAVWLLLARISCHVAQHVLEATAAVACAQPLYRWQQAQLAAQAAAAPQQQHGGGGAAAGRRQQQMVAQLLPLRAWAVACLSDPDVVYRVNWVRPSLQRLELQQGSEVCPVSILDLVHVPPFINPAGRDAGGAWTKLAVIVARKARQLAGARRATATAVGTSAGTQQLQHNKPQQGARRSSAAAASALPPPQAAPGWCGTGGGTGGTGGGAASADSKAERADAAAADARAALEALLAADPLFAQLPAASRYPSLLTQLGLDPAVMEDRDLTCWRVVQTKHTAMCAICADMPKGGGRAGKGRHRAGGGMQRCGFCCTSVCNACCARIAAAPADEDAVTAAVAAAAAATAATAAAANGAVAAAAAGAGAAPSSNKAAAWADGWCPFCAGHEDVEDLAGQTQQHEEAEEEQELQHEEAEEEQQQQALPAPPPRRAQQQQQAAVAAAADAPGGRSSSRKRSRKSTGAATPPAAAEEAAATPAAAAAGGKDPTPEPPAKRQTRAAHKAAAAGAAAPVPPGAAPHTHQPRQQQQLPQPQQLDKLRRPPHRGRQQEPQQPVTPCPLLSPTALPPPQQQEGQGQAQPQEQDQGQPQQQLGQEQQQVPQGQQAPPPPPQQQEPMLLQQQQQLVLEQQRQRGSSPADAIEIPDDEEVAVKPDPDMPPPAARGQVCWPQQQHRVPLGGLMTNASAQQAMPAWQPQQQLPQCMPPWQHQQQPQPQTQQQLQQTLRQQAAGHAGLPLSELPNIQSLACEDGRAALCRGVADTYVCVAPLLASDMQRELLLMQVGKLAAALTGPAAAGGQGGTAAWQEWLITDYRMLQSWSRLHSSPNQQQQVVAALQTLLTRADQHMGGMLAC